MKKNYTAPQLECLEFAVELGFATSAYMRQDGTTTFEVPEDNTDGSRFNHKIINGDGGGMTTTDGSTTGWF